jgi:hypothetical protein
MSYSWIWTNQPTHVVKAPRNVCSRLAIQEVTVVTSRVSRRASTLAAAASFAAAATLALALGFAPSARAGLLNLGALTGSNCDDQQVSQPFAQFGDDNAYYLVPGGTFESGLGDWNTTGDAGVTAGNEPWLVNDGSDGTLLSLAPGSSATSPPTCVSLASPTLRFFARGSGGSSGSSLSVEVMLKDTGGLLDSLQIGSVSATGDWHPTPAYLIVANILSLLDSNYDAVAFRFTPQGDATWQIDDVYVDPWSKG